MSLRHKFALILLLLALMPVRQAFAADEPVSDVRVLIDVSGSMKKNDPQNLRAPAMRMLVGLMPEQSRAGVWTFAKMVNMLVPWKPVNDDWRQNAIDKSKGIHSYGLFTNIEQVLHKATANQKRPDSKFRRSIILLSDGFVDIEPDKAASLASRQRILDQIVPKLKKLNITVHTIALSDKADHELLKALSMATDGWYRQADSAEALQRIFLHLFEQATTRDNVPLADNQFTIDSSVKEMTVLAFRKPDGPATVLQLPDGSILSQQQQSAQVRWLNEANFDLVTIDNPVTGQWQINAELDPDNRVMVVTDMQLHSSDLPNNVLVGEQFEFEANLTEKGKIITRPAFLELVDGQLSRQQVEHHEELPLQREANEAIYRATLGTGFEAGRNDVIVTMKSATFERQRRQSINVIASPISIETSQLEASARSHRIEVQADSSLIQPDSLQINALLREQEGSEWPYEMVKIDANAWRLTLTDLAAEVDYTLSLQLRGQTPQGRQVFLLPEPVLLQDEMAVATTEKSVAEMTEPVVNEETQPQDVSEGPEPEAAEAEAESMWTSMSDTNKLLIGNGIILLLLLAGVFWWRKQMATMPAGDLI
jgi:uncharacterized protein (TIGR03503 family)